MAIGIYLQMIYPSIPDGNHGMQRPNDTYTIIIVYLYSIYMHACNIIQHAH